MNPSKLETMMLIALMIFAIIGITFIVIVVHEYSHAQDYINNIPEVDGTICLFTMGHVTKDSPLGYFKWDYGVENIDEVTAIEKYTEVKAYGLSLLFFLIGSAIILTFYILGGQSSW